MSDQGELFQAQTTWFHVFKSMIDSGDLAKMSGSDIKVYMVVKSYTNFSTGRAFPAHETISKDSGLSVAQVKRCLKSLEEYGYLTKERKGRSNHYTLREKVQCVDDTGRPAAVATWDYLPSTVKQAQAELKNFVMSGQQSEGGVVHIERLTLNVFNEQAQQLNVSLDGLSGDLQARFESIFEAMEKDKNK